MKTQPITRLLQVTLARIRLALRVPLDTELERKNYRVSVIEGCLATIPIQVVATFVPVFAIALGATNQQVGVVYSLPFLVNTVALLLANRYVQGQGALLPVGQATAAGHRIFALLFATAPLLGKWGVLWILLLYSAASASQAVSSVCWQAISSDMFPESRRGVVFGTRAMYTGTVSLLTVILVGNFLDAVVYPINYMVVWIAVGVVGLVAAYYYGLYEPAPEEHHTGVAEEGKARAKLTARELLRTEQGRAFVAVTSALTLFSFGFQLTSAVATIYYVEYLRLTNGAIGFLTAVVVLFQVVGSRIWGQIGDRYGNGTVLLFTSLVLGVQAAVFTAVPSLFYLVVIQALGGFALGGYNVATLNALFVMGDRQHRPRLIIWYNVVVGLANFVAPVVGTALLDRVVLGWVFGVGGLVRLGGSGLMLLLAKRGFIAIQGRARSLFMGGNRRTLPPAGQ